MARPAEERHASDVMPPLGECTPEALLARFMAGDDAAFTALVEQLGEVVFFFVQHLVGRRDWAEDVYQTVWVKVAQQGDRFDGRAKLRTWVYRIARNAALDHLRREKRRKMLSLDVGADEDGPTVAETVAAPEAAPEAGLTDEELGTAIQCALARLPEDQREVFLLREESGMTFEEIGDLLGCGKETAKSRMRYALQRLQNSLGTEARLYGLVRSQD